MNVRLTYDAKFLSINAVQDRIFPNSYNVRINLLTVTDEPAKQNIAFQRLKFFMNEIFNNGLFVDYSHLRLNDLISLMPHKIILLPELAFDQTIGMVLYFKLNAILNNEIIVDEISISSSEGDNVWYSIDEDDDFTAFDKSTSTKKKITPWWKREDITTLDTKDSTVIFNWADIDLSWNQDENLPVIEFKPEFEIEIEPEPELKITKPKKTNKKTASKKSSKKAVDNISTETTIPDNINKNFNPTVIDGGKDTDEN